MAVHTQLMQALGQYKEVATCTGLRAVHGITYICVLDFLNHL